ncbi:MAG: hypothetical protein WCI95_13480 [bacterium]
MNAVQTIAISKLIGEQVEKDARKKVGSGSYAADFWLHVSGEIDVGEDYMRKVPQKAKPWDLLAAALSRLNGVTVEAIVRDAMSAAPEMVENIKKQAEVAIQAIKGTTETMCAGRVNAELQVEVVSGVIPDSKAA